MIKQRHTHHPSPTLPYPNSKTHSYPRLPRDGQATKKNDDMVWMDVMFLKPSSIPRPTLSLPSELPATEVPASREG